MSRPKPRPPGRPRGSLNRTSLKLMRDAAEGGGMAPHEFLLAIVRCEYMVINGVKYQPTFEQRLQAAREAAPYFAPRIASSDVLTSCSDEHLMAMLRQSMDELKAAGGYEEIAEAVRGLLLPRKAAPPVADRKPDATGTRDKEIDHRKSRAS